MLEPIIQQLEELSDPERAAQAGRFFKSGPGDYGEGDRFRGIQVAPLRQLARTHRDLALSETTRLLKSDFHEDRLLALLILVEAFQRAGEPGRKRIYDLYLKHTIYVNNWDLVDASAMHIVGPYLEDRDRTPLYTLASSKLLWDRRIAILATFHFIRRSDFSDILALAERLLGDEEDLMHKAVGWMLREVGNRDRPAEEAFLKRHLPNMPRTMLRYAIERFPEPLRKAYLQGEVGKVE